MFQNISLLRSLLPFSTRIYKHWVYAKVTLLCKVLNSQDKPSDLFNSSSETRSSRRLIRAVKT
jgi:hypothetical protein